MVPALRRGFLLPFDDICNIGEFVILKYHVQLVTIFTIFNPTQFKNWSDAMSWLLGL